MIPRGGADWERTLCPEAMTNTTAKPKAQHRDSFRLPNRPLFTARPASRIFDRPQNKLDRLPQLSASAFSVRNSYLVRQLLNLAGLANHGYRERARRRFVDSRFKVCRHLQQVSTLFGDIRRARISRPGSRLGRLSRRVRPRGIARWSGGLGSGWVDRRKRKRLLRPGSNQSHTRGNNQQGNASKRTETSCPALQPVFLALCFVADWFHSLTVRKGRIRTSKAQIPAIPAHSLV